jgi:hypothetical protein
MFGILQSGLQDEQLATFLGRFAPLQTRPLRSLDRMASDAGKMAHELADLESNLM